MKIIITLSVFLLSLSTFASNDLLLLDASCKVNCLVNITQVDNDQGLPTLNRQYETTYTDILGLSREKIEKKIQSIELDKLCKQTFSEKATSAGSECLYFKH